LAIAAGRGIVVAIDNYGRRTAIVFGLLLLAPVVRFGPRYLMLAADDLTGREPKWSDVALDLDSKQAAAQVRTLAEPGATLFVWGYRPDIYVYTRMVADGRFWDSQPLTGVPADRHLSEDLIIENEPAARNRIELSQSKPTFVVDGLGLLNPKLQMSRYPELREWLGGYKEVARTKLCVIYRRME
jgi:hypothetical protein